MNTPATTKAPLKQFGTVLLLLLFLTSSMGCSTKRQGPPVYDAAALKIISEIESRNNGLKTFKGIGGIRIIDHTRATRFRFAWAGESPNRLRVILLVSGRPVETIVADGKYLYIKSHTDAHRFIKKRSSNANLEKLISIPVKTNDIIHLLSGRIPISGHTRGTLEEHSETQGYVLTLYDKKRMVQQIFLNQDKTPVAMDIMKKGTSLYRVSLKPCSSSGEFEFPSEISLSTDTIQCTISINRSIANPEIPPDTFTLAPS